MSLLETMVVVSVLSVGAAMAVPNFTFTTARAQLKQGTKELAGHLNTARMLAMNRNTTVTATIAKITCPPATANCGRVQATFSYPGGGTAMTTYVLPAQVTATNGTSQIQFNSLGLRSGGGGANLTTSLTNSKGVTFEVQVTPAGRIRWCPTSPCT